MARPALRPPRPASALHATLGALVLLALTGCRLGPDLSGCRIIGGKSERDPDGYYVATVLVKNGSSLPIDPEQLRFEMTTFDGEDRIIETSAHMLKSQLDRFEVDHIRLPRPDRSGLIRRSRIVLKDSNGRTISQWTLRVPPPT